MNQPIKNAKWQETARELLMEEEMKECSFTPQINKTYRGHSNGKKLRGVELEFSCDEKLMMNRSPNKTTLRGERMPNSGNKFNDLYELGKSMQLKRGRVDKTAEEAEFEKSRDECTFVPQTTRQHQQRWDKQMTSCKSVSSIRSAQKTIERMKSARAEK